MAGAGTRGGDQAGKFKLPVGGVRCPRLNRYPLLAEAPRKFAGGTHRVVKAKEFPISMSMSRAIFELSPGGCARCIGIQTLTSATCPKGVDTTILRTRG